MSNPHSSSACGKRQDTAVAADPHQNRTTDANEISEGTVRRLIPYSIRFPTGNYTTIWLCRVPRTLSNRQTTEAPYPRKPLGACMPTLICLYLRLGIPGYPSLTTFAHPRDAPFMYRTNQLLNSGHDFWVNRNLFY